MKFFILIILTGICSINLPGQHAISTAGGNATGAGGTVSYTIGQVVYTSSAGTNGTVNQGVQQPYEISVLTSLEEAKVITLQWSAYPNPASNFIKLVLLNPENSGLNVENLNYQLYDMYGKLLQEKRVDGNETTIELGDFQPAIYILKVIQRQGIASKHRTNPFIELKIFKIIKN